MKSEKEIRAKIKENLFKLSDKYESVTEFAEALGRSRQTVGYWINGDRIPDALNLGVIRDRLGVSVDWILGYDDPDVPTSDEDIRKMCKYTGLSQKAIENLHDLSESLSFIFAPNERRALNTLLESDELEEIIMRLATYFYAHSVAYKPGSLPRVMLEDGSYEDGIPPTEYRESVK